MNYHPEGHGGHWFPSGGPCAACGQTHQEIFGQTLAQWQGDQLAQWNETIEQLLGR